MPRRVTTDCAAARRAMDDAIQTAEAIAEGEPDPARRQPFGVEGQRDEDVRGAADDAEQGADERGTGDRPVATQEAERRPQADACRRARRERAGRRSGRRAARSEGHHGEHRRRDAPAGRVGQRAGDDRPDQPADPGGRDQRAGTAGAAAARGGARGADHPEDPEAEPEEEARGEQPGQSHSQRLRDERERHQRGGRRAAATGCRNGSPRTRPGTAATSIASVVVVQMQPRLDGAEAELVPDRGEQRHDRRLADARLRRPVARSTRSSRSKRFMATASSHPIDS